MKDMQKNVGHFLLSGIVKGTKRRMSMLILTRRISESVIIGDDVKITVLGTKGNQVRLGIDAPRDVSVHREEIYQRILAEEQDDTEGHSEKEA